MVDPFGRSGGGSCFALLPREVALRHTHFTTREKTTSLDPGAASGLQRAFQITLNISVWPHGSRERALDMPALRPENEGPETGGCRVRARWENGCLIGLGASRT